METQPFVVSDNLPALLAAEGLGEAYDLFDLSETRVNELARELKQRGYDYTSQNLWHAFSFSAASIARKKVPHDFEEELRHVKETLRMRRGKRTSRFDALRHIYETSMRSFLQKVAKEEARHNQ